MIRLTEAEAADLERAASAAMLAVSTWARVTLLTVARRGTVPSSRAKVTKPQAKKLGSRRKKAAAKGKGSVPAESREDESTLLTFDTMRPVAGAVPAAEAPQPRCSRHKRVGCAKDPECVRETTVFRV